MSEWIWSTATSCDRTCVQASPSASGRAAPGIYGHEEIMNRGMVSVRLCRPDAVPMSKCVVLTLHDVHI